MKVRRTKPPACLCGCAGAYDEQWDAYYCEDCCIWLEGACGDPTCVYCRNRPENPPGAPMEPPMAWGDA